MKGAIWEKRQSTQKEIRVHGVLIADDDGQRPAAITPQQFGQWISYANLVYAATGVKLLFDPNPSGPDWSALNSTLLNKMIGRDDKLWEQEMAAGNRLVAGHSGKILVIFRFGSEIKATPGGFSDTGYNFIAMPGFDATTIYGRQNISTLAHELGHYLGLRHTFVEPLKSGGEARARFAGEGP